MVAEIAVTGAAKNLLILRDSPDWATFDLENSRAFLRRMRLPDHLVVDFAALWDRHFRVDYRALRAQLKALALQTYGEVRQASLLRHEDWDGRAPPGGWLAFADDDDWAAPMLFESLPATASAEDGARWGSLRLGRVFGPEGYAPPVIQRRALDSIVYTNNYAVSARALSRLGRAALFEHDSGQESFDRSDFRIATSPEYLSCAVKHPCCTMSINYLMKQDDFRADPRRELAAFADALDATPLDSLPEWVRRPFTQFRDIIGNAVQPRRSDPPNL
jgi:hypothetical protein